MPIRAYLPWQPLTLQPELFRIDRYRSSRGNIALSLQDGQILVSQRLLAGAAAGMSATLVTHPLDVIRLRMSLPHSGYTGALHIPFISTCNCLGQQ